MPFSKPHLVPPGARVPHVYGWEHLVYLAVFLIIAVGSLVYIYKKVKDERTVDIVVRCVGGVLLAAILANRISLIWFYSTPLALIPNTFCGVTSLVFGICTLFCKRGHLVYHYLVYAGFWGGAIATFYPNFVVQDVSFMYPPTITGLMHHTLSMYLAVLMVMTGFFKPELKRFYAYPIGFCLIMCYGILLVDAFHYTESMYIFAPLVPGTFLTWYVVGPALVLANLGLVVLYEKVIAPKILKKKEQAAEQAS